MKKGIFAAVALVLSTAIQPFNVQAAPTWAGTTTFDFGAGVAGGGAGIATVNWEVYAPADTGSLSGSTSQYTYQYKLSGWLGNNPTLGDYLTVNLPAPVTVGTSGHIGNNLFFFNYFTHTLYNNNAAAFHTPTTPGTASSLVLGQTGTPIMYSGTGSVTAWWTSNATPVFGSATLKNGASIATNTGAIMVPGVPEPRTWALLIAMVGFATRWLRRRKVNDAPMETSITA